MTGNDCERFQERLYDAAPPAPDLARHLASCPDCASLRRTADKLKLAPSAFPAADYAGLREKVLARAVPPAPSPLPATGTTGAILGLVAAAGALWLGLSLLNPAPDAPLGSRPLATPNTASGSLRIIEQATGTQIITSADGSLITIEGRAGAVVASRAMSLHWGNATLRCASGTTPFRANLRDGRLETRDGSFAVAVGSQSTLLSGHAGQIAVYPRTAASFTLAPGQSARLRADPLNTPAHATAGARLRLLLPGSEDEALAPALRPARTTPGTGSSR